MGEGVYMDTAAVRAQAAQELFRLRGQGIAGDAWRFAVNEAALRLCLSEGEETVFREAMEDGILLLSPVSDLQPLLLTA